MNGIISYPTPPYSNPPIEPQYYKPRNFVITSVTLGLTTLITTSENNNYVIGQEIRLVIPPLCGCRQLNGLTGFVTSIPLANEVIVTIPSIGSDAFKSVATGSQPQIIPIGDLNNGYIKPNGQGFIFPTIPGAFKNISPN
jgi:hypothetical protein